MQSWEQLSEEVGWAPQDIPFPSREAVEEASQAHNAKQLLIWTRFLARPTTDDEQHLLARIYGGMIAAKAHHDQSTGFQDFPPFT